VLNQNQNDTPVIDLGSMSDTEVISEAHQTYSPDIQERYFRKNKSGRALKTQSDQSMHQLPGVWSY